MTNPFSYQPGNNSLTALSAAAKAVFLICVSIASMRYSLSHLLILLIVSVFLHPVFGISIQGIVTPGLYIFFLTAFSAVARGLFPGDGRIFAMETLAWSLSYGTRLLTVFLYARLYYASTKAAELGDYCTRLQRLVSIRTIIKTHTTDVDEELEPGILSDPGTLIRISLLFLPRTFDTFNRIREAATMRSCGVRRLSLKQWLAMAETLVFVSIKAAITTAGALEARAYSARRTIRKRPFSIFDWLTILAGITLIYTSHR